MSKANGKVAIVTGSSRGIGAAIVSGLQPTASRSSSTMSAAPRLPNLWPPRSRRPDTARPPFRPMSATLLRSSAVLSKAHGAFRLGYAAAVAMAFLFSGLAPAVLMALIWHETSLSPGVFVVTFLVALTHSIGIGLPLFLICQLRGWINLVSCVVLGAFIGILPAGILAYPTQLSGFIAGAWTGALTDPDGVITAAIWDGYIKPLIYFGLLGAWGGFVFWAVLKCWGMFDGGRQNLPDNSLTVQASTAALPLCIARKPAAPRLTGVLSAAVPNCLMNQMVVEAEQNLDPVDNGLHTPRRRATSGKDKTPAK